MDFPEKLLTLRKASGLTQEQLAEKLEVSRQSVSKWESGQAVPELDKIVALSAVFDVTTDYLLKSSEIDDLSVKTEMLEKQQRLMLLREQQRQRVLGSVLYGLAVYLVFLAGVLLAKFYFMANDLWDIYIYSKAVIWTGFLIATAVVVVICVRRQEKGGIKPAP